MTSDPYEILGVGRDATPEEINAAYKSKAKEAHPDSGGSSEAFTRVKQASMVLLDPKKRKRFDDTETIEDDRADNSEARAMEMVANFFISSLNAMDNPHSPQLEQLDLVAGGKVFFQQQVAAAENNIKTINKQVDRFNRALKKLKTKRKNDVIRNMVNHHVARLVVVVESNNKEIEVNRIAIRILNDYEFEMDPAQSPYANQYSSPYGNSGLSPNHPLWKMFR